jgi:hypothetical protein
MEKPCSDYRAESGQHKRAGGVGGEAVGFKALVTQFVLD